MELRKYPVTAPSGNEYEATVSRERIAFGVYGLQLKLYETREKRGWLGKIRTKRHEVAAISQFEAEVTDIIEMVRGMVRYVEQRKQDDAKRAAAYEAFTHWDGHVSPKEAAE